MTKKEKNILWFQEVDKDDVSLVGGKGANLGEMAKAGFPVPRGFIVTSKAYFDFLEENKLKSKVFQELKKINADDPQTINEASEKVKKLILSGQISSTLAKEIIFNYLKLGSLITQALVAIRSSATAEDLPTASFAGQQVTFLNIRGEANVLKKIQECWASLFEARAIFYREEKGFDHLKVGLAVPVQEMVPAEISGVMFTINPVTHQKSQLIIEAVWGLGEFIVQGEVTPDTYLIDKNSLDILSKKVEKQEIQLIKVGSLTKKAKVPRRRQLKRKLTDPQIVELAKLGKKIHKHYFYPQDIEWVFYKKKFYIVQSRPVTTLKEADGEKEDQSKIKEKPILKGQAASPGLASGPVQKISSAKEINKIQKGDVLVAPMTSPDFVPAMKKVVAIITDKGGQTSHAAIVSRELGLPCIVGAKTATKDLKNNQMVTVNGSLGEIYAGSLKMPSSALEKEALPNQISQIARVVIRQTATKLYVNLAEPQLAAEVAQRNIDGVGLLRAEFMMSEIGVHPRKIIKDRKQKTFINELATNIGLFCKCFYPRPVVYRTSDFKTNEYRHLIGGQAFEPEEENPFIGFRGAFRYLRDPDVFEMELKAIKKVRSKFNNLGLMVPFVRTPQEFQEIKKIIVANGLIRSSSFKLWLMVEIPANVILLEDFLEIGIDGVSLGSNDLTMLTLGVDRDNAELAQIFNENNPAVFWAIEKTIKTCQKYKITSSICGQAPSIYPDLVEKLVEWGITSISVNPDAIERTRELIAEAEKKKVR
ncbi:phosphoenolpyruvate synthase [Candidatus Shapirobacteria bacterium CG07_land_8_20_14_0_80_39_12]|uniref:Phosphoenolpyruvate synthase n=3 Tax=Microgenomates group TaxID=1794810 RepID=A0A2M6YPS4_9BACT|nr:MAG: phosphoenolpyruvate synthase [Candidatus Shapirobacteria bacterium CG07_land_8_20_14_0_80_39_12]PJA49891.1 MAG: phosphoenolpyruvate synthase [Candidatus Shapirobacteria bacterium CG_4_9_14_3_um_filter_39_13]